MNKRLIDPCEIIYTDKPAPMVVHLPILTPAKNSMENDKTKNFGIILSWSRSIARMCLQMHWGRAPQIINYTINGFW